MQRCFQVPPAFLAIFSISEITDLQKDLCAFAVWAKAHDLFVVALEVPLYSETIGISGMCDLVGIITIKEGKETHRINVIIDFKSGRKGFYETHAFQLHIYRDLWNEMYGDVFAVKRVFNWGPKDWKKSVPTCHFEEQTSEMIEKKLFHYYGLEALDPMQPKKEAFSFSGIVDGEPVFAKTDIITLIVAAQEKAAAPLAGEIAEDTGFDAIFSEIQADFVAAASSETPVPVIASPVTEKPAKAAKKGGFTMNQLIEAAHGLGAFVTQERNESNEIETIKPSLETVRNRALSRSGAKNYAPVISQKVISIHCSPDGFWDISATRQNKSGLSEEQAVEYILANKHFTALKAALQAPPAPLPATDTDVHPNQ